VFNVSELEGQVSHEYGLKQGRSVDERWGIPKRKEVCTHVHISVKKTPNLTLGRADYSGIRRSTQTTECPKSAIFIFFILHINSVHVFISHSTEDWVLTSDIASYRCEHDCGKQPSSVICTAFVPACVCRAHPIDFCPERFGVLAH